MSNKEKYFYNNVNITSLFFRFSTKNSQLDLVLTRLLHAPLKMHLIDVEFWLK